MANPFVLSTLALVCLVSVTEAISFNNAYIQNVKSGRCITIEKDALLSLVYSTKCSCGPYQFWRMENGEHIINELAMHGYLDELWGKPGNGEPIGIYDLTGSRWQKWRVHEGEDDTYTFMVQHTSKCLRQGSSGKIDQYDCDDDDASQKWKIVENPCGKIPKVPSGRFQIQNRETGKCAVIMDNSNSYWAKVVEHECSCENNYHYWKINKKTLVSEGQSKQCLANWDALGHPGVTQCVCVNDAIHNWRFHPLEDGSFTLVTAVDGKCVQVDGESENTPVRLAKCDKDDEKQSWRFYDACHPEPKPTIKPTPPPPPPPPLPPQPINVIPKNLNYFFEQGFLDWLTPTRYTLLVGGHWDQNKRIWITSNGTEIKPNTTLWATYFGDANPLLLDNLIPGGKTWNNVFGWMTIDFFKTWTAWKYTTTVQPKNVIPSYLDTFFKNGQMRFLTPERYTLLAGGRWDAVTTIWYTVDGREVKPNTSTWTTYFGDLNPSFLSVLFSGGKTWNDIFGWMTIDFFQTWTYWKSGPPVYVYDPPEVVYVYDPPTYVNEEGTPAEPPFLA